jgi:hypothetical protein
MKLTEPGKGTITRSDRTSAESVAVLFEPTSDVTRCKELGSTDDPEEPTPFIEVWRDDGQPIKRNAQLGANLYELTTTTGERFSIENHGDGGWFVFGLLKTVERK